jgi:tripartite-type tricarboxylate transporter receptor subunit TctC
MWSKLAIAALTAALGCPAVAADYAWKPDRPITLIVPWAAGGATDQVTRVTAAEIEQALGQKVVVVNQAGASGSIGTKNALEAAKDGYTWTAGAVQDLGVYKVLGMLQTDLNDWQLYLTVANVPVVSVNPNTPYKTLGELIAAMKAKPNTVTISTGGAASASHNAAEAITRAAGVTYRHVTYDGGNPAVVAAVAGEVEATTQLATEQAEMIRGKRLRPLAVLGTADLEIEGVGKIPSATRWMPKFANVSTHFGIMLPKDVPPEVLRSLETVWQTRIAASEALKRYALNRGAAFTPLSGEAAQKEVWPTIQADAWMLHAAGRTKVSPEALGIARP